MAWRSLAAVLAVCCTILTGCPAAKNAGVSAPGEPQSSTRATDAEAAARPASEPAIQYLALDAPAGTARAVKVQGFPLVHTRQLSPLDVEGQLVGEGSAETQVEQVLTNLEAVLKSAGSDFSKLVKVNVYADSPRTADLFRAQMRQRLEAAVRPAISTVVTPLSVAGALVAADAVAASAEQGDRVALRRCEAVAGDNCMPTPRLCRGGGWFTFRAGPTSPASRGTPRHSPRLLEMVADLKLQPAGRCSSRRSSISARHGRGILAEVKSSPPTRPAGGLRRVALSRRRSRSRWSCICPFPAPRRKMSCATRNPASVKPSAGLQPDPSWSAAIGGVHLGLYARAAGDASADSRRVRATQADSPGDRQRPRSTAKATYYVNDEETSKMLGSGAWIITIPSGRRPRSPRCTAWRKPTAFTMDMIAVRP